MLKYTCLFLINVFISFHAEAQSDITFGKLYQVIDAREKTYVINENRILAVKLEGDKVSLQVMSLDDLSLKKINVYKDFPKGFDVQEVIVINKKYYFIYTSYKDGKSEIIARQIDVKNGTFINQGRPIITIKRTPPDSKAKPYEFTNLKYFYSRDSGTLVMHYYQKPNRKNKEDAAVLSISVFDKDLNTKWNTKVRMPYIPFMAVVLSSCIDGQDNVYLTAKEYIKPNAYSGLANKKKEEDSANPDFRVVAVKITAGKTEVVPLKIEVPDKFIHDLSVAEAGNNEVVFAGFYNNGKYNTTIDGIALFKLNSEGMMYGQKFREIPTDIINSYTKKADPANKSAPAFKVLEDEEHITGTQYLNWHRVIVNQDASLTLIGEQQFLLLHEYYGNNYKAQHYILLHSYDLLVAKVSSSRDLIWMKRLPKRQLLLPKESLIKDNKLKFNYTERKGIHEFIFIDNEENKELPPTQVPSQHLERSGGLLTRYTINDATGEVKKSVLLNTNDVKGIKLFQVSPNRVMATPSGAVIMEAYVKNNEDVLVKIIPD